MKVVVPLGLYPQPSAWKNTVEARMFKEADDLTPTCTWLAAYKVAAVLLLNNAFTNKSVDCSLV
ncbi:hypothetical protein CCP3SC1AL1_30040 [Gammaproteobacteria bacterium]